uniref:Poly(A) RNA polymerase mitochondrial-like central palm domain-containing protein n=1 Tax=Leishmania guyanensis TaxID=5670 RepID=A0A1E1J8N8_LEIGU|nr:hypothetical protein BN36_NA74720 [Leishmania guyanensis]
MTPPSLVIDENTRGQGRGQAARSGSQQNRHSWEDDSGCPADSAYIALTSAQLHRWPPPSFPGVRLPAWCWSASATVYPLSEDDLLGFFHYLQLTSQKAARARLFDYVQTCMAEVWGPCKAGSKPRAIAQVMLYGSYALGISHPRSDIDLVLTLPAEERKDTARFAVKRSGCGDLVPAVPMAFKERQTLCLERLHDLAEQLWKSASFPQLEVEIHGQCYVTRIHLRDMTCNGVSCDINSSFVSARVARIVARRRL